MNLRIISLLAIPLISTHTLAASEKIIWANTHHPSFKYHSINQKSEKNFISTQYELKPLSIDSNSNSPHVRYQLYYKKIPVWGHELILHKKNKTAEYFTGVDVSGIERDITNTDGTLSAQEIEHKLLATVSDKVIYKNTRKIIYLDSKNKAHLAYQLSTFTNNPITFVAAPNFIVEANTGAMLKQWDDLPHKKIGQGLGGNVFLLPYRDGLFQHGDSQSGIPSLGKFEVTVKGDKCYVETPDIKLINSVQAAMDKSSFPVLSLVELVKKPPTFSYTCNEKTQYVNLNDGDTAPANYSFSSVNDTMYFASVTLDMYKEFYGIEKPLGDDLPLRAYTHIKNFDNAFAVPSIKIKGIYIMHQQIVIGDGDIMLTAPAQSTLSHELSHNFTYLNSNLIYEGQSGGINEAFSDMASIAMQDYLRKDYPWYWDGMDWSVGREVTLRGVPIRYMDDPVKDGMSIDNANSYDDKLDVHYSSGVFNKAFYLLAHKTGWSTRKAFQVMVDANRNYWISGTHFEAAACGVIQAAIDRQYDKTGVIEAFAEVGVMCPIKHLTV